MSHLLEVCVDDVRGIAAAVIGGGDRIELCAALALGGLTPPGSLIRAAAQAPIPAHLLARPREGDFHYDAADAALVAEDIAAAAEAGLAGVVIGASTADYRLDHALLAQWVAHARALGAARGRPLSLTLHRAFDLCPDPFEALETAIELGFARILTSGGQPRAIDAVDTLTALVRRAGDRILILPGSGVDAATLPAILATGAREVHSSCSSTADAAGALEKRFGFQAGPRRFTDPAKVAGLKGLLSAS
ncbi:copper homeostasis protein CutC [Sphingomonas sp. MMS12-HWE2-04]|uniref:copper homeostasis protein CutC n=1 Tax=Sphingomonas sp. MMS12-HWE2-04 TaxID=3234199 RepID=UPI00384CB519